jgi:succinyl-CoA synthetase beta subunit
MHLHEYQAKQLFSDYGIAVPAGQMLDSSAGVAGVARQLGGSAWVVKAQVHAGGRGRGGGVRVVSDVEALAAAVNDLLGSRLVTKQTDAAGLPVGRVLVEQTVQIDREIYLGMLVDRGCERIAIMVSAAGGMDIEAVAARDPAAIITETVNPAAGLQGYQCRNLAFALELEGRQISSFANLLAGAFRLLRECDASLLEINPLVVTGDGELLALPGARRAARCQPGRCARTCRATARPQLHPSERQYRLHGKRCRTGDGDHGPDQAAWW